MCLGFCVGYVLWYLATQLLWKWPCQTGHSSLLWCWSSTPHSLSPKIVKTGPRRQKTLPYFTELGVRPFPVFIFVGTPEILPGFHSLMLADMNEVDALWHILSHWSWFCFTVRCPKICQIGEDVWNPGPWNCCHVSQTEVSPPATTLNTTYRRRHPSFIGTVYSHHSAARLLSFNAFGQHEPPVIPSCLSFYLIIV